MGFAEMEEANTRISRLADSSTGESRTAAREVDRRKQRRKEAKKRMGSRLPQESEKRKYMESK